MRHLYLNASKKAMFGKFLKFRSCKLQTLRPVLAYAPQPVKCSTLFIFREK